MSEVNFNTIFMQPIILDTHTFCMSVRNWQHPKLPASTVIPAQIINLALILRSYELVCEGANSTKLTICPRTPILLYPNMLSAYR